MRARPGRLASGASNCAWPRSRARSGSQALAGTRFDSDGRS
ncbi:hypothetical protein ACIBF6_32915 [Streptosporangium amethystogenes]